MAATMGDQHAFLRRLMGEILELHQVPKAQVERAVGPMLGLFLPTVLDALVDGGGSAGFFEVVSPEFPLKRGHNNQSTNIDWLVVRQPLDRIVFVELKTAPDSVDQAQLETYQEVRRRIEQHGAGFLIDDLRAIRDASSKRAKYDALLDRCAAFEEPLRRARSAEILCLVPRGCRVPAGTGPVIIRHFHDLPATVAGAFTEEWTIVRDALLSLDGEEALPRATAERWHAAPVIAVPERPPPPLEGVTGMAQTGAKNFAAFLATAVSPATSRMASSEALTFGLHVRRNLQRAREQRTPVRYWIGNTGSGEAANYQVEFHDGTVQTYHYSGAHHRVDRFKASNLKGPFTWPEG